VEEAKTGRPGKEQSAAIGRASPTHARCWAKWRRLGHGFTLQPCREFPRTKDVSGCGVVPRRSAMNVIYQQQNSILCGRARHFLLMRSTEPLQHSPLTYEMYVVPLSIV